MTKDKTPYYLPAEWEPQIAVQLTWPHAHTDWQPYLQDIVDTEVQLARVIARYQEVLIATQDVAETKRHFTAQECQRIRFVECPLNDTWARDHGFITLLPKDDKAAPQLLDFQFNGWGNKFEASKDNLINRQLVAQNTVKGEYVDYNDFVLEGGSIESDGKGTILTTSLCLLAPNRNQPLTQQEIERKLLDRLHADRILWIDYGKLVGDDTDGHIDTTVRFAPNDTLLYIGTGDEEDVQYDPIPQPIYYEGERLPATYANFVVINGAVIVPTYQQDELDRQALDIIGTAFPHRDIIPIDATTVIKQHGSLHCLTMQQAQTLNGEL